MGFNLVEGDNRSDADNVQGGADAAGNNADAAAVEDAQAPVGGDVPGDGRDASQYVSAEVSDGNQEPRHTYFIEITRYDPPTHRPDQCAYVIEHKFVSMP